MKRQRVALIGIILMIILGIMWFFASNTQKQNTNYDLGSYKSDSTISETYDETSNKPKTFKRTILKNDVTLHDDKDETDEESSSTRIHMKIRQTIIGIIIRKKIA